MMEPDAPLPSAPFGQPPLDSASSICCGTYGAVIGEGGACCPQDPQAALEKSASSSSSEDESISENDAFSGEEDEDDESWDEDSR